MQFQLVVLVIRPILFCCLELRLQSPADASHLTTSPKVRHLLSVSSEAAQNMIGALSSLQEQGLLESFLPWDFDALFVSTTVLILIRFIDSRMLATESSLLSDAFALFEYMARCGNDVAAHRNRELRGLRDMLEVITATSGQQSGRQGIVSVSTNSSAQCIDLTAEQILTMTDDMEIEETDWMSLLMFEPSYAALEA
jgi:proline utilization trans-activator